MSRLSSARRYTPGPRLAGLVLLAAALLAGCATHRPLMPTPNLYASGAEAPFPSTLSAELRGARVAIPFATDRRPETRQDGRLEYGTGRSTSLAFGLAEVDIGVGVSWETLRADALSAVRDRELTIEVAKVKELTRTPSYPLPYVRVGDELQVAPQARAQVKAVGLQVERALSARLALSPRRELLLYVHGVANSFDEALSTTAELWHYTGREFVPVAFTWPAGRGGLLRGYTYDRESSEFAVYHFKRFLDWLSTVPEVDAIHIVAHSRGTDVVTTGIRELLIEARAAGQRPRDRLKLRNVVLAAPDINLEVTMMRTATELFATGMDRLTMYTSPHDGAIGIAEFLFGGGVRLGNINVEKTYAGMLQEIDERIVSENVAIVEYVGERGGAFGHDYFRTNPAVSSDLVLTVRFDRDPGAAHGRPLRHETGIFWEIDDGYLEAGARP